MPAAGAELERSTRSWRRIGRPAGAARAAATGCCAKRPHDDRADHGAVERVRRAADAGLASDGDRRRGRLRQAAPRRARQAPARFMPCTPVFNLTGQPAITMPAGFGGDGLPLSVQLVGRVGRRGRRCTRWRARSRPRGHGRAPPAARLSAPRHKSVRIRAAPGGAWHRPRRLAQRCCASPPASSPGIRP